MDAAAFFTQASEMANKAIVAAPADAWHDGTPCSEWDLKALVNHMVYETAWVSDLLAGKSFQKDGELHGGDLTGEDPQAAWQKVLNAALADIAETPMDTKVTMSVGEVTAADYINEVGFDLLVHGWDVAQAIGQPYDIPAELLVHAAAVVAAIKGRYGGLGTVFAAPVPVNEAADGQTRFLAGLGRGADVWRNR
jgi:uncharacterized protein (TIGR03086 family)